MIQIPPRPAFTDLPEDPEAVQDYIWQQGWITGHGAGITLVERIIDQKTEQVLDQIRADRAQAEQEAAEYESHIAELKRNQGY